ncbi:MAG TPA: acetolactate synthase small subunit [Gemmatimonadales bacterium]|jgi:acetolactate synthase-1/3 small subunit|nr:acetolactate synthase small subunit [Gemmatimonadales bacterium]
MSGGLTLSVLLEHDLVTFTRAVGVLRRRNFPIKSIAVGPSATPGLARLTIMMEADQATADRAARQLEKIIGVREASAFPAEEGVARELALVNVRAARERHAELLDIALLYKAAILDESADGAILEVSGSEAFVLSFLRALEGFELVEVARSGAVAVGRTSGSPIPVTHTSEAVQ